MKNLFFASLSFLSIGSTAQTYVLDETFGTNGVVHEMLFYKDFTNSLSIGNQAYFLSGDKIVKVGENGDLATFDDPVASGANYSDFKHIGENLYQFGQTLDSPIRNAYIAKMDLNGNLISDFGQNGISVIALGSEAGIRDILLTAEGDLLCAGEVNVPGTSLYNLMSFKINPANGGLIATGNSNGIVQYSPSLVESTDTFSGGFLSNYNNSYLLTGSILKAGNSHLAIINIDADGTIISDFGANGYRSAPILNGLRTQCKRVRLVNNKLYCNYSYYAFSMSIDHRFAAYDLDSDQLIFNIANNANGLHGIGSFKVYEDGIFTTVKSSYMGGTEEFILTKKLFTGMPDTSFHINGSFTYDSPTVSSHPDHRRDDAQEMVRLDNGDILIGGYTNYSYFFSPTSTSESVYDGLTIIKIKPGTLGRHEQPDKAKVALSPNPFSDKINLKSETGIQKVEIYDLAGKKIDLPKWETENGSVDLQPSYALEKGIYLIKIYTQDGKCTTEKILKE